MLQTNRLVKAISVASALAIWMVAPVIEARTFGCVDIPAPAHEGDRAGTPTRGTRVAFDEIDVHPMQLWWRLHHLSQLFNNTGQRIAEYYALYYRGWGPGDSTIYVRWWVLPPMTYTNTAHIQSQYSPPTYDWVQDYEYKNCFVPVPFL